VFRVVNSTETSVGTVVNVSCPAGQKLQTGDKMMITLCSQSGDWSPHVPDCIGKLYANMSVVSLPFKSFKNHFCFYAFTRGLKWYYSSQMREIPVHCRILHYLFPTLHAFNVIVCQMDCCWLIFSRFRYPVPMAVSKLLVPFGHMKIIEIHHIIKYEGIYCLKANMS